MFVSVLFIAKNFKKLLLNLTMATSRYFAGVITVPAEPVDLKNVDLKLKNKCAKLCIRSETIQDNIDNQTHSLRSCDIHDISWLEDEKRKIIDHLKEAASKVKPNLPDTNTERFIELYAILTKENAQQLEVLEYATKDLKEEQTIHEELTQSLKLIESNMKNIKASDNKNIDKLDVKLLRKNSEKTFNEMKNYMHNVLENLYIGGNMKSLIEKLTNAYFKGGDNKYVDIAEDDFYPGIELLKQASLIICDPYDDKRIKFADFM